MGCGGAGTCVRGTREALAMAAAPPLHDPKFPGFAGSQMFPPPSMNADGGVSRNAAMVFVRVFIATVLPPMFDGKEKGPAIMMKIEARLVLPGGAGGVSSKTFPRMLLSRKSIVVTVSTSLEFPP